MDKTDSLFEQWLCAQFTVLELLVVLLVLLVSLFGHMDDQSDFFRPRASSCHPVHPARGPETMRIGAPLRIFKSLMVLVAPAALVDCCRLAM